MRGLACASVGTALLLGCTQTGDRPALPALRADDAPVPAAAQGPRLRIVAFTALAGVLEGCGCTRAAQGGVDRLAAALEELRREPVPLLALAAGSVYAPVAGDCDHQSPAARLKADALSAVLGRLRLDAIAPAASDLACGAREFETIATAAGATLLLGAGVVIDAERAPQVGSGLLRSAGGLRIGIAGAPLEPATGWPAGVREAAEPLASLRAQVAELRRQGAQFVVALVAGDSVAPMETGADATIAAGAPFAEAAHAPSELLSLRAGRHAEGLLILELSSGPDQRVAVRSRFRAFDEHAPRNGAVRALLLQLFRSVNAQAHASAGPALPEPQDERLRYVGSKTCAACHTAAYFWWLATPHGRAFDSLVARERQLDLDCIGCHVTGYGKPGGASVANLEQLAGVGCESCHGPGAAHADNPRPTSPRAIRKPVPQAVCESCHDAAHSEAFEYPSKRRLLLVPEHGGGLAQR